MVHSQYATKHIICGTNFVHSLPYLPHPRLPPPPPSFHLLTLTFTSAFNPHRTVAAFVLVYPTFSTFCAGPNLYVEDLFVRPPYRSLGLGTLLLRYVCRVAAAKVRGGSGSV